MMPLAARLRSALTSLARVVALLLVLPAGAFAQQLGLPDSVILTISSERLFSDSAFGKRVAREFEAASGELARENRRIEQELTLEEQELTDRRPNMEPAAFRELADAFDAKVKEFRRTQDAKARALVQKNEEEQVKFIQAARPILTDLMQEAGAGVVLERSSVFLSVTAIDVTEVAINRLNATIRDGVTPSDDPADRN
ncbi:OmpH family outer membrane protein [Sedimentitalea todarodis]|uniref:OmpH family outer membrane protein n=1 Tax=Sedimentitalea todarodis TaxID=1631240 RepID=A0ABU3VB00_9RHOB|nr:OmpH family outer membrane protein [Sedimentitalea todarodis]MDU9003350.1 OmpH family outer membrane protein [Sedimentitalea todarodis]